MTEKQNFSQEEWTSLMQATALVGIGMIKADKSSLLDTIRELVAYASALVDAEKEYQTVAFLGTMIGELRSDKQKEFHQLQLNALRPDNTQDIIELVSKAENTLAQKLEKQEYDVFKRFLFSLLQRIAEAANEGVLGTSATAVSPQEQAYIDKVEALFVH